MRMRSLRKEGKRLLAVGLLLFALAARLLFPGVAAQVRDRLLGGEALSAAFHEFCGAAKNGSSLSDAIAVFCEALDAG